MDSVDNNQLQSETLETKLNNFFSNIEFSDNQKTRIIESINKYKKQNEENSEEENIQTALRKLKRYIKKEGVDKAIALFENEVNTNNETINANNETINEIKWDNETSTLSNEIINNTQWETESAKKFEKTKDELYSSFNNLDDKYKFSPNQEQERKSKIESLSPTVKSKLKEANVPEEQYVDFLLARDRIPLSDTSSTTQDFLQSLRDFEDALWLREETKWGLPLTYSESTFTDNKDLNNFRETDSRINNINTNLSYFWENIDLENEYSPTKIQNIIQKYKHLEGIYNWTNYIQNPEKFEILSKKMNDLLSNPDEVLSNKADIRDYIQELENSNQWITKFIQWSAAQAPYLGLINYLDSYEDPWEQNFANKFSNLNIDLTQDPEDETMNIKGLIDWNPITFFYHFSEWKTNLECDDILKKDWIYKEGEDNTKWRSDLNIDMPSLQDIIKNLEEIPAEKYQDILTSSNNIKEFQTWIWNLVWDAVKDSFADDENIKNRLSRYTEKNLTSQSFIPTFITDNFKPYLNEKCSEDKNDMKDILELIDNTTERANKYELRSLKKGFEDAQEILNKTPEEIQKIKDPVVRDNFLGLKNAMLSWKNEEWEKSFINFFNLFKYKEVDHPDYKINIDDFNKFINLSKKTLNTNENDLNTFSPEFQEKYKELNNPTEKKAQDIETIHNEEEENEAKDPRTLEAIESEINKTFEVTEENV